MENQQGGLLAAFSIGQNLRVLLMLAAFSYIKIRA